MSLHIAIVAGEASGDLLGASLLADLKKRFPDAVFSGVGGEAMKAQGFKSLIEMKRLSVMGLIEVVKHLPDIFRAKNELLDYWQKNKPDIFIGIDAPDFNLRLAKVLHARKIKTVHYVSPSLWAWKEKRIFKIKENIDLMLCLFPFELPIYEKHGVKALCVGHAMTERLQMENQKEARQKLNLNSEALYLGLFVGSRISEIKRLLPIFIQTFQILKQSFPELKALLSLKYRDEKILKVIENVPDLIISQENSALLMNACDVLLLKSGTITLEATVLEKPAIVAYQVNALTAFLAKRLLKIKRFALPNLLMNGEIMPEYIQDNCTPELLAEGLKALLNSSELQEQQKSAFRTIKSLLPQNASETAGKAIEDLIKQ